MIMTCCRYLRLAVLGVALTATSVIAQTVPVSGLHENTPNVVALTGAKVVVAPGRVLQNATVIVRESTIEAVGENIKIPADAMVREQSGKTIYAGFIDLYTHYGMPALKKSGTGAAGPAPAQTQAAVHWNKFVRPEQRAADILSHDEKMAGTLRKNGFTTVLTMPRTGIFRGTGAVVQLTEGHKNETLVADQAVLSMSMSKGGPFTFSFNVENYPSSLMGVMALMRQTFHDNTWYHDSWAIYNRQPKGKNPPEKNLSYEVLQAHLQARKPVIMAVSDELNLLRAASIAKEFNLPMLIKGRATNIDASKQ